MAIAKKAAPAKGKALVNWDEKFAKYAQEGAAREAATVAGGNFMQTAGGILKYKDAAVPGNKMKVVVVNYAFENQLYKGKFNPSDPRSPDCYALAMADIELAPHENVEEPQNEVCEGCPMNEWETADNGIGKACKNIRRLALISAGDLESSDTVEASEIALLRIPVTSTKAFASYIRQLSEVMKRPAFAVVTEISVEPNPKTQFLISFKFVEMINDQELFEALIAKQELAIKKLLTPYPKNEDRPAPPPAKRPVAKGRAAPPARKGKF